jgi:addiction module RelE/StbE family toxin
MTGVKWSKRALGNLEELHAYIAYDNLAAADKQVALIFESVLLLARFPAMGRAGRIQGMRELSIHGTPYVVAYKKSRSNLFVLAVMHGAQKWPKDFD